MFIKICGITNIKDARTACYLGASAVGFVFAKSKRQITARQTAAIVKVIPHHIEIVGVFVDEPLENLKTIIHKSRITAVQLHGQETNQYILELADIISKSDLNTDQDIKIIKTLKVGGQVIHGSQTTDHSNQSEQGLDPSHLKSGYDARTSEKSNPFELILNKWRQKKLPIWKYLVEPHVKGADGGSGKGFDWQTIKNLNLSDIIVAGGIKPANIHSLLDQIQPFGIDLSSGVEKSPGVKDELLMKVLFENIPSTG